MSDPILLAIETTQREGGLALRDADGAVHVETLASEKRHDDDLMPAIDRVFTRAGLRPGDLRAVGISIGPGGFTGLRIAVSTVKMLATVLPIEVVAVPTALAVAESVDSATVGEDPILVALASKRETVWVTRVVRTEGAWRAAESEENDETAGGALAQADEVGLEGLGALIGDRYLPDSLRARCAECGVPIIEPQFKPESCLAIASRRLIAGTTTNPLALLPLYPRPPEAVTLWEHRRRPTQPGA